ncbi:MAG: 60S ribosomal protein L31 [Candidatus Micrarchaeota archaeon]|nr:60S ribosomal protein L31 [Candidatus Micrarchaeota archaeon]
MATEANKKDITTMLFKVNLRRAFEKPRTKRAKYAILNIRKILSKELKNQNIKLHESINKYVFKRGIEKIPRRVELVVKKEKDSYVAYLSSEYEKMTKKETVKVLSQTKEDKSNNSKEKEKQDQKEQATNKQ